MSKFKSITNWAEDDRPREKLLKNGRDTLSVAELIAIILGSGSRDESAVDLAKRILTHYDNSLNKLSRASVQELCKEFKGVGVAKAVSIVAIMELSSRKSSETSDSFSISCSKDACKVFSGRLSDLPHEEFWIALLNNRNKVLSVQRISSGGIRGTVTDKSILLKKAIEYLATGIIICHNHPSGSLEPSEQDIRITKSLKESCDILDINLLDHIIIGGNSYFSFADSGYL